MGTEDIDKMIADALAAEEPRGNAGGGRRPLAHGQHILDQYAALCREGESPADPSAEVVLPVAPAGAATAAASTNPVLSMLRRALVRVTR